MSTWKGAEAWVDGKPTLVRCRDLRQTNANPTRPHLLVVDLGYPIRDDMQLPLEEDYHRFRFFEARVFDGVDPELVFVETGSGTVRYFCYTWNVDQAADVIEDAADGVGPLKFSSALDPHWLIYQEQAAKLQN